MSAPTWPRPCANPRCRVVMTGPRKVVAHTEAHGGRGLCDRCYRRHLAAGTIDDYPRITWRSVDLVRDAEILRARDPGMTWTRVALHLGVSFPALDRARVRVRRQRASS